MNSSINEWNNEYELIFESFIDGKIAFESGLFNSAQYILEESLEKAQEYYKNVGKHHGKHISIIIQLGKVYMHKKRFDRLSVILDDGLFIEPANLRLLYTKFLLCSVFVPDEKSALKVYERAAESNANAEFDYDYEVWKKFESKGGSLKRKRRSDIFLQNSKRNKIEKQNLMKDLPTEILENIFKYLDLKSFSNLLQTCRGWRLSILESPNLIRLVTFNGNLTLKLLNSYLRLFDQRISLSEIMLDHIELRIDDRSEFIKILKLLLSTKLKVKTLNLFINSTCSSQIDKLVIGTNSELFYQLQNLNIKMGLLGKLDGILASLLISCRNLRMLHLSFVKKQNISFKTNITFTYLITLEIYNANDRENYDLIQLIRCINAPNLQSITLSRAHSDALNEVLKRNPLLKTIKLHNFNIDLFIQNVLFSTTNDFELFQNIETLEFKDCTSKEYIISSAFAIKRGILLNLKTLIFDGSYFPLKIMKTILNTCKDSLQNLFILRSSPISTHDNIAKGEFNLKTLLLQLKNLRQLKITDAGIDCKMFSTLMFQVATLNIHRTLDLLELTNSRLDTHSYIIMLISIAGKLSIKDVRIYGEIDDQLKQFIELAKNAKSIETFETVKQCSKMR